jgi:hypothetical protein
MSNSEKSAQPRAQAGGTREACRVVVRTRQAGERVMASLKRYLEKKLRLNIADRFKMYHL